MNEWKCTLLLVLIGTVSKNRSINILLPEPTVPCKNIPRGRRREDGDEDDEEEDEEVEEDEG